MKTFEAPKVEILKLKISSEITSLEPCSESGDINDYDENMLPKN